MPRSLALLLAMSAMACSGDRSVSRRLRSREPVELPALITTELPFRYPPGLYLQGVQDDVTLRLFIDSSGAVVRESTRIEEPSRYALFDSSAMEGATRLSFRPARQGEHRLGHAVLFPVKFRVPNGPTLPQDTAQRSEKE
ncbi:MAG: hypothetical protein MNPFHGCM_00150 [Gemmatimonadaceae bacterium]|nr:hypothetical protein [Gemmatimonadaceae bacterium]